LSFQLLYENIKIKNLQKYNFPLWSVWCETWSLILGEEYRLRVSENRILRLFGPKREEVTGGWRKLQIRSFVYDLKLSQYPNSIKSSQTISHIRWLKETSIFQETSLSLSSRI
jgi:hypothetical protein